METCVGPLTVPDTITRPLDIQKRADHSSSEENPLRNQADSSPRVGIICAPLTSSQIRDQGVSALQDLRQARTEVPDANTLAIRPSRSAMRGSDHLLARVRGSTQCNPPFFRRGPHAVDGTPMLSTSPDPPGVLMYPI
jgi:hypothetical protein